MSKFVYVDGKMVPKEKASVSVFDHGLLYGDGVFEGIRSYNGRVFRLEDHVDRLYDSARAIMMTIPITRQEMIKAVIKTLQKNKLVDAYIRLVVTRGKGDLGLDPRKCPKPTIIVITDKIQLYPPEFYNKGLQIISSSIQRATPSVLSPRIKSLNYLNNILAKIEAIQAGVIEAIMLNLDGYVCECTGDNIFIIKGDAVITPPEHMGILKGITRDVVIEIAAGLNLSVREKVFTMYDVYTADECFLTGTAAEIIPIINVNGREIGTGKPGKFTHRLMGIFKELTQKEGTPIYE